MKPRDAGNWIQTFTGRHVDPFNMKIEDVAIEDIAHSLSCTARFGGHASRFYSVAQHSMLVSAHCPPEHRLWGLMHDAAEAYIGDVPRPIKHRLDFFNALEEEIISTVARRFSMQEAMPEVVRHLDTAALAFEAGELMGDTSEWGGLDAGGYEVDPHLAEPLMHLTLSESEDRFLALFSELSSTAL